MRISWAETHAFLATVRGLLTAHPLTVETHDTRLRLAERYGLSINDAMIAAAAVDAGCAKAAVGGHAGWMVLDDELSIANPLSSPT